MLQRQTFTETQPEDAGGFDITPAYVFDLLKRRWLYFVIPFVLLLAPGLYAALKWPAEYVSTGTILVRSSDIPTDLVRPIVVGYAAERIEMIRQRIMTRDNLFALAKKYNITPNLTARLSGKELVDFIKDRTVIQPVDIKLPGDRQQAIAFKVGFDYEDPIVATKVANDLTTMILQEDASIRSGTASETARFIQSDVQRLEGQLAAIDAQIATLKLTPAGRSRSASAPEISSTDKELEALRTQLIAKRAVLSEAHPDIRALKRRIALLEESQRKQAVAPGPIPPSAPDTAKAADSSSGKTPPGGIDTLETKRASLKSELDKATNNLAVARLGENLERGQHAERFEVIEQPIVPTNPVKPSRVKLLFMAVAIALMGGGAVAGGSEVLDRSVRRASDLRSILDATMIISIPYITTSAELRRKRNRRLATLAAVALFAVAAAGTFYLYGPDPDILVDKIFKHVLRS